MKAVILAGGEGTRLRPLSLNCPKPMVTLFEKPILEHTLTHLKNNGITDMILTLQTLPHVVTDYFGDGSGFGVSITSVVEETPLGTAGAVRACSEYLDGEPFVVISGDGVCDFDINEAVRFHRANAADVTILLSRQNAPRSYGLVMTGDSGRVARFIEKPSWNQVFTDTVNTGIYVLEPRVLSEIPPGTMYDFAKDLFPRLMEKNAAIYGYEASGYWCDVGDTGAYLKCAFDVLDGKVRLDMPVLQTGRGIWSGSALPEGLTLIPPCYIGNGVELGRNVTLGPYAVLASGSVIGDGASVSRGYVDAANVGARAEADGAIVCKNARVGAGAKLREGSVAGSGAVIGANAVVMNDARIWPDKEIDEGARVSGSISAGYNRRGAVFDGEGRVTGQPNVDLPPDFLLRLGSAAAVSAKKGEIALCYHGGKAARLAAAALETGITAAGRSVALIDAEFAAAAAFAAGAYNFALTIFASQSAENIKLYFFGSDGLPADRALEHKMEAASRRGEIVLSEARAVGEARKLSGVTSYYELSAGETPSWFDFYTKRISVSVRPDNAAERSLYHALLTTPVYLRSDLSLPWFKTDAEGFRAQAADETGRMLAHERLLAILCAFEASQGNNKLAAAYSAPVYLDSLAEIVRHGRDAEARELLSAQPYMRDGVFLISRLCHAMTTSGKTLAEMNDALPPFGMSSLELNVETDRGAVMRALAAEYGGELVEGVRAEVKGGWVHITPVAGRRALRVTAECAAEEYAAELCGDIGKKIINMCCN